MLTACSKMSTWHGRHRARKLVFGSHGRGAFRAEDFKRCFPCNCVTVLSHKFSWSTAMLLAPMQQEALKQRLAGQPVHKLNWEWCWKLSQEMHVPYVTVSLSRLPRHR